MNEITEPLRETILELVMEVQRLTEENQELRDGLNETTERFKKWTKAAAQKWQRVADQVAEHDARIEGNAEAASAVAVAKPLPSLLSSSASNVQSSSFSSSASSSQVSTPQTQRLGAKPVTNSPSIMRRQPASPRPGSVHPHGPQPMFPPTSSPTPPPDDVMAAQTGASPRVPRMPTNPRSRAVAGSGSIGRNAGKRTALVAKNPAEPGVTAGGGGGGEELGKPKDHRRNKSGFQTPSSKPSYTMEQLLSDSDDDGQDIVLQSSKKY